eukprot:CAMPEP_0119136576 /NCGR_PEP_ID=MMETSP1310-20130426/21726_1 /TAXON_ID=464262 /ORGANISM="Genus nov. species nov., Strain RCC2339" /LENGTH=55 /DNA_ID=CAMNT_0007127579 /DNA_START=86 /DNA_END=250 /DNA_ORIENTATION=+
METSTFHNLLAWTIQENMPDYKYSPKSLVADDSIQLLYRVLRILLRGGGTADEAE